MTQTQRPWDSPLCAQGMSKVKEEWKQHCWSWLYLTGLAEHSCSGHGRQRLAWDRNGDGRAEWETGDNTACQSRWVPQLTAFLKSLESVSKKCEEHSLSCGLQSYQHCWRCLLLLSSLPDVGFSSVLMVCLLAYDSSRDGANVLLSQQGSVGKFLGKKEAFWGRTCVSD